MESGNSSNRFIYCSVSSHSYSNGWNAHACEGIFSDCGKSHAHASVGLENRERIRRGFGPLLGLIEKLFGAVAGVAADAERDDLFHCLGDGFGLGADDFAGDLHRRVRCRIL